MSYTPTSWSTGDTITAAAMNKIENGIANAGGSAIVELSANGYATQTNTYASVVWAVYNDADSKWVVYSDDNALWQGGIVGFANEIPSIIPPFFTVLPSRDDVGLFIIVYGSSASVSGNIIATNLYYQYGSMFSELTYRITGDGSISITA